MPKAIVNPRRFSHRKDFRKIRKALINKEKTSNHNGLLVFAVLVEQGRLRMNTPLKLRFRLQMLFLYTQFKDLHIFFAERGLELIHQCLCYRCFLHILRRVRLLVFLSAVGVSIGLLKFLQ